jgi:hypothetical protein
MTEARIRIRRHRNPAPVLAQPGPCWAASTAAARRRLGGRSWRAPREFDVHSAVAERGDERTADSKTASTRILAITDRYKALASAAATFTALILAFGAAAPTTNAQTVNRGAAVGPLACPADRPHRCPQGYCARGPGERSDNWGDPAPQRTTDAQGCTADRPYRCPSGDCVKGASQCPTAPSPVPYKK